MSVFVSGISGYVASRIVYDLLDQGYSVIGTVRNQEKADKILKQYNSTKLTVELVPEIANLDAFDECFKKHGKNIKYVIHAASPVNFGVTDFKNDMILPSINGTKNILESISKYAAETVERFVLTASYASVMTVDKQNDPNITLSEKSWNPVTWETAETDVFTAYCASKTFAEKAAREYLESSNLNLKMTSIHPGFVFGPQTFDDNVTKTLNASCEIVNTLMHAPPTAPVEKTIFSQYIDVRDISKSHILAFQKDNLIGKRLLMCNGAFGQQDIINVINDKFPQLKGKIPPSDPNTDASKGAVGNRIDNKLTRELLGFQFKPFEESIYDTVHQILKKEGRA